MGMVISVSVIFDTGDTYSCSSNNGYFVNIEEKMFLRNLKGIEKGLDFSGFGIVKYSDRSDSGNMVALRAQAYYITGLPNYLCMIYPQFISTLGGYKGTFIAHCHNDHDSYTENNLKEDKPGWQKAKPLERVNIKYDPKNNFPTHDVIIPNQRENKDITFKTTVCVTKESNQNLTSSQKYQLQWYFILGHLGFQHVQWLIRTWHLKVQLNTKLVYNCERPKCDACEFVKGHL